VLASGKAGQFALEFNALRSQDESPRIQRVEHGLADFAVDEGL